MLAIATGSPPAPDATALLAPVRTVGISICPVQSNHSLDAALTLYRLRAASSVVRLAPASWTDGACSWGVFMQRGLSLEA